MSAQDKQKIITLADIENASLDLGFGLKLTEGHIISPDQTKIIDVGQVSQIETGFHNAEGDLVRGDDYYCDQQYEKDVSLRVGFHCQYLKLSFNSVSNNTFLSFLFDYRVEKPAHEFYNISASNGQDSNRLPTEARAERRQALTQALQQIQKNVLLAKLNLGKEGLTQDLFTRPDSKLLNDMVYEGQDDGKTVIYIPS